MSIIEQTIGIYNRTISSPKQDFTYFHNSGVVTMLHLQLLSFILVAIYVNQAEKCCYKSSNTLPDASTEDKAVMQARCAAVCIDEVRLLYM